MSVSILGPLLKLDFLFIVEWWLRDSKESACNAGYVVSIPGLGRSL